MYVFQGVAIQKRHHDIKRRRELESTGHNIDDPRCLKFFGYEFAHPNAVCEECRRKK